MVAAKGVPIRKTASKWQVGSAILTQNMRYAGFVVCLQYATLTAGMPDPGREMMYVP